MLSKLPFPAIYIFSNIAAYMLFHVFRYRRNISFTNLARSFPQKPSSEIKQLQKSAYLHLTDSFLEILKASDMSNREILDRIELRNFEEVEEKIRQGQSIFFLTAHTAPIDWVAFAVHLRFNCLIDPVYKPIHAKALNNFIFNMRSRHQGTPIPYKKIAKDVILRKHVQRCIAMLADLEPRSRDQSLEVKFLNQPTRFFFGSEKVVKLANFPTYFIAIKKTRRGHYQAYAHKLSERPKELKADQLTRQYADCVEHTIIENPAAWLWTHKRWKRIT